MSKSIYEDALEIIDRNFEFTHGYTVLGINDRTKMEQALKQAQKQEKLLELYKELDACIVAPTGHHVCRYTDDEKYDRIRKRIKELENGI